METTMRRIGQKDKKIIDEITISLAILFTIYTELGRNNKRLAEELAKIFSTIGRSNKDLAHWHLYLNFSNLDDNGIYAGDINEGIDRFFSVLSSETNHKIGKSTRSKILAKLVKYRIWYFIKTKNKIKDKSPQSLSRTKGTKKDKRGGPYVLYKNTVRIKNYRRILDNPTILNSINQSLANYKDLLKNFYTVWFDNVLNMIKEKGNQQMYAALMIPAIGQGVDPRDIDWKSFRNAINDSQNKNKLKEVKQQFISDLLRNPNKDLFFNFIKVTTSERIV
ncbi:MAG: hypothetical protein WA941_23380 [Nitrososphaeraceae archaeon]